MIEGEKEQMWKRKDMIEGERGGVAAKGGLPSPLIGSSSMIGPDLLQMFHFVKCDWSSPTHGESVLNSNFAKKIETYLPYMKRYLMMLSILLTYKYLCQIDFFSL